MDRAEALNCIAQKVASVNQRLNPTIANNHIYNAMQFLLKDYENVAKVIAFLASEAKVTNSQGSSTHSAFIAECALGILEGRL